MLTEIRVGYKLVSILVCAYHGSYGKLYDQNGNATSDGGSKTISYNLLNLPQNVTTGSTTLAKYTYAADGNKLRDSSSTNGVWDYDNGIVYLNGNVSFIQTEEGKASLASPNTQFTYTYDFKDYLGNVRASFDNIVFNFRCTYWH
jgi:hypothetical protein